MFDLKIIAGVEQKMNDRYDYMLIHYVNNTIEWLKINDNDIQKYKHVKMGSVYYNDEYINPLTVSQEIVNDILSIMPSLIIDTNQDINYLKNNGCEDTSVKASATLYYKTVFYLQKFISTYKKLSLVHSLKRTLQVKSL